MAQIRVDDTVYNLLKDAADKDYRTIGGEIEYLLRSRFELSEIKAALKNKSQNPENGSGSQANNQEPTAEHLGRREAGGKSYSELKAEKTKLIAEYKEKINYCQDYGERDRLQHELDRKLKPIQFEIDEMFRK